MFCFFKILSLLPVRATVMSNTLTMDVPWVPLYFDVLPQILSAAIRPCLFAGPARGISAALPGFAAQLQRLDLRGTGVGNAVLPLVKHLPQLQQLVLADTAISWESKAGAGVALAEGAAPMHAAAAAPELLDELGGPPDWRATHATGAPVSQHRSSGQPAAGWPKLQMLDVTGTQLTDAGCAELSAELLAAASAGAGSSSGGLRALHIGSCSHKLGRKALLAVTRLTTLQQLTLQVRMPLCASLVATCDRRTPLNCKCVAAVFLQSSMSHQ
jgi:hypothetical protein